MSSQTVQVLPVQQLEHQLQSLSLILSDHLRALCQDRVLEGGDENLSYIQGDFLTVYKNEKDDDDGK